MSTKALITAKEKFRKIVIEKDLMDCNVSILVKTLSPEEAIGSPGRSDFPILIGKERVIEADFIWSKAHVFTDTPREFTGKLKDVFEMSLSDNGGRALFIAAMNSVLKHLSIVKNTIHCKDEDPEECAREISSFINKEFSTPVVGLIGLNPAILDSLRRNFGTGNIRATDLNPANIGMKKYGTIIWDGETETERLIRESDVVLLTGTTFVNDSFDGIWEKICRHNKKYIIFGVTCAGICELLGLNRICPRSREKAST